MNVQMKMMAGCLLAGAALAGQTPVSPVAPVPPAPPVAPAPPAPPAAVTLPDFDFSFDFGQELGSLFANNYGLESVAQAAADSARYGQERASEMAADVRARAAEVRAKAEETRANARALAQARPVTSPNVFRLSTPGNSSNSEDGLYQRGFSALDRRRYEEALENFTQAYGKKGPRADAALYWCAYSQHRLGKRDDALASIANLRKSYPNSRWLEDAKALEIEVKQSSGVAVSPDAQPDEDLKILALNGVMMNDPERAIPTLEGLLKGAQSPRLKKQTLFVLASSSSPKAQQVVEQVARGSANPDLQVEAIQYLASARRRTADGKPAPSAAPLLLEIFNSTQDAAPRRAVLTALVALKDTERLRQIAENEKNAGMRAEAVQRLMAFKDASLRDSFVKFYGSLDSDKELKRSIVSWWANQDAVKQIVQVARSERDPEMVRYIVSRLANMKSPEAADYLMEVVKK